MQKKKIEPVRRPAGEHKVSYPNGSTLKRGSYDPAIHVPRVIALGKKGYSKFQIAADFGVSISTIHYWDNTYEDFHEALEIAKVNAITFFENMAQRHMIEEYQGKKLNTALWSRSMSARFPLEYSEKSRVELTGANGNPIELNTNLDFTQNLVDDLLKARQNDAESKDSK